jgi:hypothetical protein
MDKSINIQALKAVYDSNRIAKSAFEYFLALSDRVKEVTVDDLQSFFVAQQSVVTRQEIISFFKELVELGLGDITIGRRHSRTRFTSKNLSLQSLAKTVVEENRHKNTDEEVSKNTTKSASENINDTNEEVIPSFAYRFPLREKFPVILKLPLDLTVEESDRLASYIKSLPYI